MDTLVGGIVVSGGYAYGSGHWLRDWYCVDIKTGKMKWKYNGAGQGGVTMADGMLYLVSEDGKVTLAEASPKGFNFGGSFQIKDDIKDVFWAHPVVIGGRLYIRHDKYLYVYEVKKQ